MSVLSAWKIGRIAGIELRVHWTFLILFAWIGLIHALHGNSLETTLFGLGSLLALFGCVVLHELGHALAAQSYGIQTRDITLLPIGGLARLEHLPRDPKQELWVAVAGPLVNVVIAAGLFGIVAWLDHIEPVVPASLITATVPGFLVNLMWLNVMLAAFNMVPAFPMDGGRVLRALLGFRLSHQRATEIAVVIGQSIAILFATVGLFFNPWLLLIALFIFISAGVEAETVRFQDSIHGIHVREAMMTEFHTLSPWDSLQHAADVLLASAQRDFPVVDQNGVVGVLHARDLIQAVHEQKQEFVGEAMEHITEIAHEDDAIEDVVASMSRLSTPCLPVVRDGSVIGVLTFENIGEMLALRSHNDSPAESQIVESRAA